MACVFLFYSWNIYCKMNRLRAHSMTVKYRRVRGCDSKIFLKGFLIFSKDRQGTVLASLGLSLARQDQDGDLHQFARLLVLAAVHFWWIPRHGINGLNGG